MVERVRGQCAQQRRCARNCLDSRNRFDTVRGAVWGGWCAGVNMFCGPLAAHRSLPGAAWGGAQPSDTIVDRTRKHARLSNRCRKCPEQRGVVGEERRNGHRIIDRARQIDGAIVSSPSAVACLFCRPRPAGRKHKLPTANLCPSSAGTPAAWFRAAPWSGAGDRSRPTVCAASNSLVLPNGRGNRDARMSR